MTGPTGEDKGSAREADGVLFEEDTLQQRAEILMLCWLHSNRRSTDCDGQSK
jgi:hypothetical protein